MVANSALVLQLEGDLPEQSPVDFPIPFLEDQQPPTIAELARVIDDRQIQAANKDDVEKALAELDALSDEEIRALLAENK